MRRRVLPATAVTAVIVAGALTSCSSAPSSSHCEPLIGQGALSASVQLSGTTADDLSIEAASEISTIGAQRSVVREGEATGSVIESGSIASANLAYFHSGTGEALQVSPTFGTGRGEILFSADPESLSSIVRGSLCATEGDTLAIALGADESASMGVLDGAIVVIAEITDVASGRAEGTLKRLPSGFPAIATDSTGRPGLVLPPQEAPSETRTAIRVQGSGELVQAEDMVVGQVLTVDWNGVEERNTWTEGPLSFGSESEIEGGAAPSFRAQLTGVPTGSQVVIIEPSEGGVAKVSVVDVLAVG